MAEDVDPSKLEIADELIAERRSAAPGELPDDMHPKHRSIIGFIDTFNEWVGKIVCWMLVPLCLAVVYEVILRNFGTSPANWWGGLVAYFDPEMESPIIPKPTLWAYDISRMLYGAMFMLGAGYALSRGVHIRADFIYRNWSDRTQGIIDLVMYCTFFMIGMAGLLIAGSEYFYSSVVPRLSTANDSSWAPYLWPIRLCIPVSALFLMMQGVSEILKCWYAATRGRWPV